MSLSTYMYMYAYMYLYMYMNMYIYIYIYVFVYTHVVGIECSRVLCCACRTSHGILCRTESSVKQLFGFRRGFF